jgi:5'-3' exonuclease
MPFPFDGERVVDDFVMLTVLCGNDFVPHLPSLDIGEGALDTMLRLYRWAHPPPHPPSPRVGPLCGVIG